MRISLLLLPSRHHRDKQQHEQQQQEQRHHLSLRHSLPFELPLRRFHFRHRQRHCAVPLLLLLSIGNSHTVEKRENTARCLLAHARTAVRGSLRDH
jgi:hypothetical protein